MSRRISGSRIHIAIFFLVCINILCLHAIVPALARTADNAVVKRVSAGTARRSDGFFLLDLYDAPQGTVDIDKGSKKITQVKVFFNKGYTLPSPSEFSLSRPGYYFAGWMTKEDFLRNDGKATYRPGDVIREEFGNRLYAYWKKIPNRTFSYLYDHEDEGMKKRIEEKLSVEPGLVSGQLAELDASITEKIPKINFKTPLSFDVDDKKRPDRHVIEKWTCKEVPGWSYNGSELTEEQIKTVIERYKASGRPLDQVREEAVDGKWMFRYTPVNFTFVVHFKFLYRTVTFDLNYDGAQNRVLAIRKGINGDKFTITERPEKPRFGYRFMGWSPNPNETEHFFAGGPYDLSKDHRENLTVNPGLWADLNGFSFLGAGANVFTLTSDTILYAIWAPKDDAKFTYTVNDEAGGYVTRKEETVPADGDQEPLGSTAVANEGWAFLKWGQPRYHAGAFHHDKETLDPNTLKLERCGHASGTRDQSLKSHISRHFVAHFVKIEYHTIAFSSNVSADEEASVEVPKQARVKARHSFQIPHDIPQRNGYRFTDWDTHPDGGGASYRPGDVIDAVSGSITLYAQWVKDIEAKLSYSVNNAERGEVTPTKEIISTSTGSPSGAIARPRANSEFKKWICNLDPDWELRSPVLTKEEIDKVAKNDAGLYVTAFFTACFEPNVYKLSFDKGDTIPDKALDTLLVAPGKTVPIPKEIPSRPDRIFVNWNDRIDGKGASYKPGDMITVKEDTTLYAQWLKAGEAKFTYLVNDATQGYVTRSEEVVSASGGSPRGSFAVSLGDGNVFKRWECNISSTWKSDKPALDKEQIDEIAKDETGAYKTAFFTAYFETKNCKITFNSNGGGTEAEPIRVPKQGLVKYNEDFTLPTEVPVRAGYTFAFWSTKRDETGALYKPGAVIKNVTHDMTLYAVWERAIYKVVITNPENDKPETHQFPSGTKLLLPSPRKIPSGKTLKGIKVSGRSGDLLQPGEKIAVDKDITITFVYEDGAKTVTLTYKVSDPEGGTLSKTEEMVAPNAETVEGTHLTVRDGWKKAGWSVSGSTLGWSENAGLTLTQEMIDRAAKKDGIYQPTTFTALVERLTYTVVIEEDGQEKVTERLPFGAEYTLPSPKKIPSGKMLKGIKVSGRSGDLLQPGEKIAVDKDITITFVYEDGAKTVTLTYKVSDPEGGTLSKTEEMVAPNAETVEGTRLTVRDGWKRAGWSVSGSTLGWSENAGLTLTQEMIDRAAKKDGIYQPTTFTALVERLTYTVVIEEDGQEKVTERLPFGAEYTLPSPKKIPSGKTLKGIKVSGRSGDLLQPGEKIAVDKDITITFVYEDGAKTVTLTYKVSDPEGGTLSKTEEMVAPNAETVEGTRLTVRDGWKRAGWSVSGSTLGWSENAGLTLTQEMIDRAAKKDGIYQPTTFTALVERLTYTVVIEEDGQEKVTERLPFGAEYTLPSPKKIPSGKTLKGIKVSGRSGDLLQPGEKIAVDKDITITFVYEDGAKTVTLTYKVSDPEGGTLSKTEEMVAPNAETVEGTRLTVRDGWKRAGWSVSGSTLGWSENAGLTLTQEMIDRAAKKDGIYQPTTFTALVERLTYTVVIEEDGQEKVTERLPFGAEYTLPSPKKIPSGKTLKGIKVSGRSGDLLQPGEKIAVDKDITITFVYEDGAKTVTLTYKVSDPEGGTLSKTEEMVAPNAETVEGTHLTVRDGWKKAGWSVSGSTLGWSEDAGLTLTQEMIDRAAKKDGIYQPTTFTALVERLTYTVVIEEDGQEKVTERLPFGAEYTLPSPKKIPSGKTLKGIKVSGRSGDLLQPGEKIAVDKDITITFVYEDGAKTVTLTYKVSDPEGGTLSKTEEMVAPNAEMVEGTRLTVRDGWKRAGWSVSGSALGWSENAGPTLTQEMIDRAAKKDGIYQPTTFTALVERLTYTVVIEEDGQEKVTERLPFGAEYTLPSPKKIPSGKTLKGIKVSGRSGDLLQPGEKIAVDKDITITFVYEDGAKTVTLTYKVSDPEGGTLSKTEEMVAPNAETVEGTRLTVRDGWKKAGWSVSGSTLGWSENAGLTLTQEMIDRAAKKDGIYQPTTFTALVERLTYTVVIEEDGQEKVTERLPFGAEYTLPSPKKIPSGKTLKGIKVSGRSGDLLQPGEKIAVDKDITITFVYEDGAKTVTLTYKVSDPEGGTLSKTEEMVAPNAEMVEGTRLTVRDGWKRAGWSVSGSTLGWSENAGLTLTQEMIDRAAKKDGIYQPTTFTALVERLTYTVVIEEDGQEKVTERLPFGAEYTLPSPKKIPSGKMLKGIKVSGRSGDLLQPGEKIAVDKDITITFVYEDGAKTVTLTYKVSDPEGGTLSKTEEMVAPNAEMVEGTRLTVRDGWKRAGWSVSGSALGWSENAGLTLTQEMIDRAAKKDGIYQPTTFTALVERLTYTVVIEEDGQEKVTERLPFGAEYTLPSPKKIPSGKTLKGIKVSGRSGDLLQPGEKIAVDKDITITFVYEDGAKTVTLTYKVSDPEGGTLSKTEEMVAPNAETVEGTHLTVRDGWKKAGWSVSGSTLGWSENAGLTLTQEMIDRAAKKDGIYQPTTFTALVERLTYTVVIEEDGQEKVTERLPFGAEYTLPSPKKIPSGKMLKGIKVSGRSGDLLQPGEKIAVDKDITITFVYEDGAKTVTLTYKVSDPEGGTLSKTEEMVAPNAEMVEGTRLTVRDGWKRAGWSVSGSTLGWSEDAGLTLTQEMIDRAAKKDGIYQPTTFTALVERLTYTVVIEEDGQEKVTERLPFGAEYTLPSPKKIPSGKTLKGIKVSGRSGDLLQPGEKIAVDKDITITFVYEDGAKTVTLTYKVSDPEGGTLSKTEEMVAPNAEMVEGTRLTVRDGWKRAGWSVSGSTLGWSEDAGLTLTQEMIDRAAKKDGIYQPTTFTALVERLTYTVVIEEDGQEKVTERLPFGAEYTLPSPKKIPSGKTLKGIKVSGRSGDLLQPGEKIAVDKDITITFVYEDGAKTVTLTYKVSDPEGGTLSKTEEMVAPNAETVEGTRLTVRDGWKRAGWSVSGSALGWSENAGLTLTQEMIDRAAKKDGIYQPTTFTALVERLTYTVVIEEDGQEKVTERLPFGAEYTLPSPKKIPSGKTLKGIKVSGRSGDLLQPGEKIAVDKDITITFVYEDGAKTVTLTYKVSDPEGGTLSKTEEMVAPNAETVEGTRLTVRDGWKRAGWSVSGSTLGWSENAGLTLTQEMIDRAAKKDGIYQPTTFTALVERLTYTVVIEEDGQEKVTERLPFGAEYTLPSPKKIPSGKTLKGIKVSGRSGDLLQPGEKIAVDKDITITFVYEDGAKTVTLTYKVSDPEGGTLSKTEEMVAPNAETVEGTRLTVRDGWKRAGWSVSGSALGWSENAGLTLTQEMIDRAAKKDGIYQPTTFTALVERLTYTVVIEEDGQEKVTERLPFGAEYTLPSPKKIPSGKTLKGIKVSGRSGDLLQPGEKIAVDKDITITFVYEDGAKTVTLTYKVSDPEGGTLSKTEEMVAPNAETVEGTRLTVRDGWKRAGWSVSGSTLGWSENAGLTLTQEMIDRAAKKDGIYQPTTFTALVERLTYTVVIEEDGQEKVTERLPFGAEYTLPSPKKIPSGKTLKGIKVSGRSGDLLQPGEKIAVDKDITITFVYEDGAKTVTLTYKVSDPEGGTLSKTEEMVAPNAETVEGTRLTVRDGWKRAGWSVSGSALGWSENAGLTLTQEMIDRAAKKDGIYQPTTFTALVERLTYTVVIEEDGQEKVTERLPFGAEYTLPSPKKIPSGKTLKGIKVSGRSGDLLQPGEKIAVDKDITITFVYEDGAKTVTLTYKVSDPEGGTLSKTEEMVAPNAETVEGTRLTVRDGWKRAGWSVSGSTLGWSENAGLTLTQEMIDRAAKKDGIYQPTTFTALVERLTYTVVIEEDGQEKVTERLPFGAEYTLPSPKKIPSGKTLKGIKVSGRSGDLLQPGEKIAVDKDITITFVYEDGAKTVTLTYKVSDPEGGTLSKTEEMVAPNAETVEGTRLTVRDGWKRAGWSVSGSALGWSENAGLTLTQEMIDRAAKKDGIYQPTTFTALVERLTYTVVIEEDGQEKVTERLPFGAEYTLPSPKKIPSGKTLKGIKVSGRSGDLLQPGEKIAVDKDITITFVYEDGAKTVTLTYKVSDPEGGTLSKTEEMVAPNAETVEVKSRSCSADEEFSDVDKKDLHRRDLRKVINGWHKQDNKVFYYKDGEKLTGWQKLSGTILEPASRKMHWFYFDADGVMLTGRHKLVGGIKNDQGVQEEHWFLFDTVTGVEFRGWDCVIEDGIEKWYYYGDVDGAGYTGRRWVLGGFKNAQGLHEMNWFYFDCVTGVEIRGWHKIIEDGIEHWYYYRDGDGIMLKGQHKLVGGFDQRLNWFYFDEETGIEIHGWKEIPYQHKWCYYGKDGAMFKGQHELVGGFDQRLHWFYFDEETGGEIRGWKEIPYQHKWCYYGKDGAMFKGQHELVGGFNHGLNWFYFDEETGGEIRGWKEIPYQHKWCYYGKDGAMLKGQHELVGGFDQRLHWFYFDEETGAEIRGWKEIPYQNKWCYYGEDGVMYKGQHELVGGFNHGKNWFYFNKITGAEVHGWKYIKEQDKTCYYGEDGAMYKGWHIVDDEIYYFNRETGAQC